MRLRLNCKFFYRHWHTVYIGERLDSFEDWRDERPELLRQGELFAYMHHQMLARYNAERQSWGLCCVQAINFYSTAI